MSTYVIRPLATLDLEDIRSYIARNNPRAALRTIDAITSRFRLLAEFPLMGEAHPELYPNIRLIREGNYLVFYFPREYGVEIARVFERHLQITSVLLD